MSKELTPLEALRRLRDYENLPSRNPVLYLLEQENLPTYYKVIETALKENEKLKTSYLNNLLNEESKEYIYKKLKALEIIKKRECLFKGLSETTQEEYELLKEVLL